MSAWVDVGLYLNSSAERLPLTALEALIPASPLIADRRFSVVRAGPGRHLEQIALQDPVNYEGLLELLQPWNMPDCAVSARTTVTGYRVDPDSGDLAGSPLPVRIDSLGGRHVSRTAAWWIDADVRLLTPATPYTHLTSSAGKITQRLDTQRNLDVLTALLHTAIGSLRPDTCKVYTDAGEYLPFNAHLAYFAGPEEVCRDLALIGDLFAAGHPKSGLPPLGDLESAHTEVVFHPWRHRAERRRVQLALASAVLRDRRPNAADVLDLLTSNTLHVDFNGPGFMLVSGPAPMNGFLDTFYLELFDRP